MAGRPVDHRGLPVPWFVTVKDGAGHWDFTRITPDRYAEALRRRVCWVSGEPLGRHLGFVVDPETVFHRVAGDPAMKPQVAEWALQVCPFLARSGAERPRRVQARSGVTAASGTALLYVCADFTVDDHGLIRLGPPTALSAWRDGARAPIDLGPVEAALAEIAPDAHRSALERRRRAAEDLLGAPARARTPA